MAEQSETNPSTQVIGPGDPVYDRAVELIAQADARRPLPEMTNEDRAAVAQRQAEMAGTVAKAEPEPPIAAPEPPKPAPQQGTRKS